MGISRLLRKQHDGKTQCTIDWLSKYHYRQFGRAMIAKILDGMGVMPLYRTKNTQNSEFTPIYNLEQCIAAIDEYQKALNEQTRRKKNKRGSVERMMRQIADKAPKTMEERKEEAQEMAMLTAKAKDTDNA
jgi:hypothetical protein